MRLDAIGSDQACAWSLEPTREPRVRLGNWNAEFIPQSRSHHHAADKRHPARQANPQTPSLHEYLSEERVRGEELPAQLGFAWITLD